MFEAVVQHLRRDAAAATLRLVSEDRRLRIRRTDAATRHDRHVREKGERTLSVAVGDAERHGFAGNAVQVEVPAQDLVCRRCGLEGVDGDIVAACFRGEQGEQTDIGTDIEDDVARCQCDAVPEIDPVLEYLAIEEGGLAAVEMRDRQAIGQGRIGAGGGCVRSRREPRTFTCSSARPR